MKYNTPIMLAEAETLFSVRIADSIPKRLRTFRGLDLDQGSWTWCADFNRRLIPSLVPLDIESTSTSRNADYYSFLKSWNAFQKIEKYTDGEAFFLCYPAAFQFGLFAAYGEYDSSLFSSWQTGYLNDQRVAINGAETSTYKHSWRILNDRLLKKYNVQERLITSKQDLTAILDHEYKSLHVVQVYCNYPMFGNQIKSHYLGVIRRNNSLVITGGLAPYGIYETPFATVAPEQFSTHVEVSNIIGQKSSMPQIEIYTIMTEEEEKT